MATASPDQNPVVRYVIENGVGYRYEGRTRIDDPEAIEILRNRARDSGVDQKSFFGPMHWQPAPLLASLVQEGKTLAQWEREQRRGQAA